MLGVGSNVLVRDGGIAGVVINTTGRLAKIEMVDELRMRVESGVASLLDDADLAIRDVNLQPALDLLERGTQWVTRAGLDIAFGVARYVIEPVDTIEFAGVTGSTTPPTPGEDPQIIG